jgi:hypothetical protein
MNDAKTRFQQIRENNLTAPQGAVQDIAAAQYPVPSHARNLCLAWSDGSRLFLNYSYLVTGQFLPDEGSIILTFTTHKIVIKGLRLETLFMELMDQLPRVISCSEERYAALADQDAVLIQGIAVEVLE